MEQLTDGAHKRVHQRIQQRAHAFCHSSREDALQNNGRLLGLRLRRLSFTIMAGLSPPPSRRLSIRRRWRRRRRAQGSGNGGVTRHKIGPSRVNHPPLHITERCCFAWPLGEHFAPLSRETAQLLDKSIEYAGGSRSCRRRRGKCKGGATVTNIYALKKIGRAVRLRSAQQYLGQVRLKSF